MEAIPPADPFQLAYQYKPLPTPTHVRRCIVQPDAYNKPIVIAIDTVALEVAVTPVYEALSYAWGSKVHPLQVTVDCGKGTYRSIAVTQNLYWALRHLRYTDSARFMWVDAICIDQDNDIEKGPQVAMMSRIYQRASRVVAWLGPNTDNAEIAMKLMGSLGSQVLYNDTRAEFELLPDNLASDLADLGKPILLRDDEAQSLISLLSRPWFTRLWIRQEIFFGNESSIVCCGGSQVSWLEFRNALRLLSRKDVGHMPVKFPSRSEWKQSDFNELQQARRLIWGFPDQPQPVLPEYMRRYFDGADCIDKRDRVFAVLSFLGKTSSSDLGLEPDYTQTFEAVYINTVERCIKHFGALNIIGQCELSDGPPANSLPSWIPDWSRKSTIEFHTTGALASSHISPLYKIFENQYRHQRVLQVAGVITTSIQKTGPEIASPKSYTRKEAVGMLYDAISNLDTAAKKTSSQNTDIMQKSAWTMLCGNVPDRCYPSRQRSLSTQDPAEIIRRLFSETLSADQLEDLGFRHLVSLYSRYLIGRRLGWDARGALIVCPGNAEPGDLVSILVGCRFPMMLRPLAGDGQGGNRYVVVGECFTADTCDGDAMLGPLPQGTRIAQVIAADWEWGFVNDSTGEVSFFDPRLAVDGLGLDMERERRRTQDCPGSRVDVTYDGLKDLIKKRTGRELRWLDLV